MFVIVVEENDCFRVVGPFESRTAAVDWNWSNGTNGYITRLEEQ